MRRENKKVLIITYYWPPSGGSGVQRWLKFVKYLPGFGWEPHVFTPENPSATIKDESLLKDVPEEAEVVRFPIWEPYDLFFRLLKLAGSKKANKPSDFLATKNKSLLQLFASWVRGNFLIPDPRVFWVKPSVRFLDDYLKDNRIGTIITTGPPHSVHLIGLGLKRKNPSLRWLADFRDPWSEWGLLESLHVGKWAMKRHKRFESDVLSAADEVITITPFYVKKFELLANRKVQLLTNGFDEHDFECLEYSRADKFIIRHVGIINEKCDPRPFLSALVELMVEVPNLCNRVRVEFIGEVHQQLINFVERSDKLKSVVLFEKTIPHKELVKIYGSSSLLLLILTGYKDAEGYMPGKLFEYIATRLPVLGIGPVGGDAASLLKESGAGVMVDSADAVEIKKQLMANFKKWSESKEPVTNATVPQRYSRRAITEKLIELL